MLLVLTYWCYLFLITSSLGLSIQKGFIRQKTHAIIIPFIGGFTITLFASIWSIFGGLGTLFELFITGVTLLLMILQRKHYRDYIFSLKAKLKSLPYYLKIVAVLIILFASAQCASAPYTIDNESYYIQTIKWLDTYGFVNGLSNFHFFLGQTSGWHILQSALNINGFTSFLNDLNGFYLILGNLYALEALGRYIKTKETYLQYTGLFPLFNIFLFQFISAPSPDLPIYVLTLIIFGEFITYYNKQQSTSIAILFLLGVFAIYIKVTAVFLLLFPVLLYLKHKGNIRRDLLKIIPLSICAFILFAIKNSIITGYPLYPLDSFSLKEVDWTLPLPLQQYLVQTTKHYAFFMTPEVYDSSTFISRTLHWLLLPKLHGFFNLSMCAMLLFFPIIILKSKTKKPLLILFVISILQLVFLWLTSPQYRFFFGFLMLLTMITLTIILQKEIYIKYLVILATLAIAVPLFIPFDLNQFTKNEFQLSLSRFSIDYLLTPHPKTKYTNATYKKVTEGNLQFNAPINIDFFWATGDCELPCIQEQQLQDFKAYFLEVPQMRTEKLSDGFYSKKVARE